METAGPVIMAAARAAGGTGAVTAAMILRISGIPWLLTGSCHDGDSLLGAAPRAGLGTQQAHAVPRRGLQPGDGHGGKQRHDDADGQALVTGGAGALGPGHDGPRGRRAPPPPPPAGASPAPPPPPPP